MKFSIRDLFLATMIVALVLALIYVKWPSGVGRYQFEVDSSFHRNYYIDTATGKVWMQSVSGEIGEWREWKTPDVGK